MMGMCSRECWIAYCWIVLYCTAQPWPVLSAGLSVPPERMEPVWFWIRTVCRQVGCSGSLLPPLQSPFAGDVAARSLPRTIWSIRPIFSGSAILSRRSVTRASVGWCASSYAGVAAAVAGAAPQVSPSPRVIVVKASRLLSLVTRRGRRPAALDRWIFHLMCVSPLPPPGGDSAASARTSFRPCEMISVTDKLCGDHRGVKTVGPDEGEASPGRPVDWRRADRGGALRGRRLERGGGVAATGGPQSGRRHAAAVAAWRRGGDGAARRLFLPVRRRGRPPRRVAAPGV